jgi:uncharacterized membrane protein
MTWQKFYELWDLYGPSHDEWGKYATAAIKSTAKADAFGLGELFGMLKKVDLEKVRTNISGIQKAIGLVQDMTTKSTSSDRTDTKEPYNPRPMYRRFED